MALNTNKSNQPTFLQIIPVIAVCGTFLYTMYSGFGALIAFYCFVGLICAALLIKFYGYNKPNKFSFLIWAGICGLVSLAFLFIAQDRKIENKNFEIRELKYKNDSLVASNTLNTIKSRLETLSQQHQGAIKEIDLLKERNRYQLDSLDRSHQNQLADLSSEHEAEIGALSLYTEAQLKELKERQASELGKLIKGHSQLVASVREENKDKISALTDEVFDLQQKQIAFEIREDSILAVNATLSNNLDSAEMQLVKLKLSQVNMNEQHQTEIDSLNAIIMVYSDKEQKEKAFLLCKSADENLEKALNEKNKKHKITYLLESKKAYLAVMETGVYDDEVIQNRLKPVLTALDQFDKDNLVDQTLPIFKLNKKRQMTPAAEEADAN